MALESHLLPNESLVFQSGSPVKYGQSQYRAYVSTDRLILHAKRGLLGRDDLVSFRLKDVGHIDYRERGLLARGEMVVHVHNSKVNLTGRAMDMKQLYQQALAGTQR